ncbi:MAG: carbohydrate-binding protein, partial [Anaerolineae bacterium]|nr:carbohydrate-binding protein [Anaerolineae bacterium]
SMSLSPSSLGSTNQNWIGRSQYAADPYLDGQVDDFRIYNRALSASEVGSLASGSEPTPTATHTPLGPTPSHTPTSSSSTYQAEDASLGGGVSVDTNHAGYNGSGFVNFPSSGGYVAYQNVDGGSGGSRTLQFRFALGVTSSRTGQLTVNGVSQNITFQPTGAWATWATMNVTVTLNPGAANTIRLQSTGQDLANQDQMTVY